MNLSGTSAEISHYDRNVIFGHQKPVSLIWVLLIVLRMKLPLNHCRKAFPGMVQKGFPACLAIPVCISGISCAGRERQAAV